MSMEEVFLQFCSCLARAESNPPVLKREAVQRSFSLIVLLLHLTKIQTHR